MQAPRIQVKCGVDNCEFWRDRYCNAHALEVNAKNNGYAETSDGTCCTTFRTQGMR